MYIYILLLIILNLKALHLPDQNLENNTKNQVKLNKVHFRKQAFFLFATKDQFFCKKLFIRFTPVHPFFNLQMYYYSSILKILTGFIFI